jgi:hypothetical protein
VNNAAVRIAETFRTLNTPLDMVRVGEEDDIADALLAVHTAALRRDFISMLEAEWSPRMSRIGGELGLTNDAIDELLWLYRYVITPFARAESWGRDAREISGIGDRSRQLKASSQEALKGRYGIDIDTSSTMEELQLSAAELASSHSSTSSPSQCAKFLAILSVVSDTMLRLRSDSADSTFGEFLVKTRAVACGTCVGIGNVAYKLADKVFDWAIVDEAARCTPAELAVAIQSARRVILVGDHKQLPPFIQEPIKACAKKNLGQEKTADDWFTSDFEEMFDEHDIETVRCASLWDQYRMVEPISRLVSELVYDKKLNCLKKGGESWLPNAPIIGPAAVTLVDTSSLGDEAADDQRPDSTSYFNEAEANAIVDLISSLVQDNSIHDRLRAVVEDQDQAPIGVICTYSDQVALIQQKLIERDLDFLLTRVVKLGTVDSYQGRENLIVIVSLVRSGSTHDVGHVAALERINVALSRAKERLVIVGDGRMWTSQACSGMLAGRAWSYISARLDGKEYHRISPAEISARGESDERAYA